MTTTTTKLRKIFIKTFLVLNILSIGWTVINGLPIAKTNAQSETGDSIINLLEEKKELQAELIEQKQENLDQLNQIDKLETDLWVYESQMEHLELIIKDMTQEIEK